MFHSSRLILGLASFLVAPLACLWDYDTLSMERNAIPTAHEAIVGYFARHSEHYYRWRIDDRSTIEPDQRSPSDEDDIAVAYEKLGKHDKAIEVIRAKMKRWPDEGRYESEANLATFLIHSGRWAEGLTHIDNAIKLNADAHFGREIYQRQLVQYLMQRRGVANPDDTANREDVASGDGDDGSGRPVPPSSRFDEFLFRQRQKTSDPDQVLDEHLAAIQGLIGMLRFGNHDSPVLLSALGDLLSSHLHADDRGGTNANRLAARAYLVASYETEETARSRYRQLAVEAVSMQVDETIEQTESALLDELRQAEDLEKRIAADERRWVDEGRNLDVMFAAKYSEIAPLDVAAPVRSLRTSVQRWGLAWASVGAGAAAVTIALFTLVVVRRRRNRPGSATAF